MKTIVLHTTSGPDGKLHLEVPVGQPDTEFELKITAQPKLAAKTWPPGYFDLFGSIDDETFVRPPKGSRPPVEFEGITCSIRTSGSPFFAIRPHRWRPDFRR